MKSLENGLAELTLKARAALEGSQYQEVASIPSSHPGSPPPTCPDSAIQPPLSSLATCNMVKTARGTSGSDP